MTNQEIITRGELIRDETVTGANTAQRVGEAFVAIGENLSEVESQLDDLSFASSSFYQVEVTPDIFDNENVDDNMYIDKNGNMQSLNGAHIKSYQVLKGEKYRLTLQYPQNNQFASLVFALFNSPVYSSATLVEKSQSWMDLTNEETLEIKIQQNGYLAVVPFSNNFKINVKLVTYKSKADDVEEELAEMEERLSDYDSLYVKDEQEITSDIYNVEDGKYITQTGAIADFSMYELLYFPVNSGDKYTIRMENGPSSGSVAYIYAFYNTANPSDFNAGSKIGTIGPSINVVTYNQEITVPDGAVCMALTRYKGGGNYLPSTLEIFKANDVFFPEKQEQLNETFETDIESLKGAVNEIKTQSYGEICAELSVNGENLYIAFLDGTTEITYWFKKCMVNELFTFYRVGYRTVERSHPDTDGISSGSGITYINKTGSDNIGPLNMVNGGWTGGNHTYSDGSVFTAKTDSYTCYADGILISAGDKLYCKSVLVKVSNTIYDPAIAPNENDDILSSPLCSENVIYSIQKNTIEVSLRHQFVSNTANEIRMYYGMQSMFDGEEYIMTPNGEFPDWVAISSSTVEFNKASHPLFNRFIENSSTKGTYQATYLYGNKLGNHDKIPGSAWIFQRSSGKCYHHLMQSVSNIAGKSFTWNGGYTFFHTPLRDDSDVFAYLGVISGKDALFVNTKQSCIISIDLPEKYLMRKISVIEVSDTITTQNTFVDVDGISIEATGSGSFICVID